LLILLKVAALIPEWISMLLKQFWKG